MGFRPCIDLHHGKVKQIVGSTLRDDPAQGPITNFETDRSPADFALMYCRDKLPGGHVIMLGPGNERAARLALDAYPGGLQVGGGITPLSAHSYLDAGASHVILTSFLFENGRIGEGKLREIRARVGKERLVIDLSCRKRDDDYHVVADRWQTFTDTIVSGKNLEWLAEYCDEFLVHAVDVEGMRQGPDEELIELLARDCPLPVTYAGGVTSLKDLETVRTKGKGRVDVTVGSALDIFGGTLPYETVVAWHRAGPEISASSGEMV